jgi:hypothetical protein
MKSPRALQGNASDLEQIQYAKRKETDAARIRAELVRRQLSTAEGRQFVWIELERAGVFDELSGPMDAVYFANAERNPARRLLRELMEAHPDAYLLMHAEAIARVKRIDLEIEAAQTSQAERRTNEDTD